MGPAASGQVIVGYVVFTEYRRDQQAVTQHILTVQILAAQVVGEFQQHGAHGGNTRLVGDDSVGIQVRHQAALIFAEEAAHIHAFGAAFRIKQPRHTVGAVAVQAGMGGQQAKRRPALVHFGGSRQFKAGHVVAPETKARQRQAQATAQGFRHGREGRAAVAAPVHGELLAAHRSGTGEDYGFVVALHSSSRSNTTLLYR